MDYRYKRYQFWKKKPDVPNEILEKIYNSELTINECLEYDLVGKIPLDECLESKYRPLAKLVSTEQFLNLEWSLITDTNLPIVEAIIRALSKEERELSLMDAIYKKIYEKIVTKDDFFLGNKRCDLPFDYTEDMSTIFKEKYPELFLEGEDLPDTIRQAFYDGNLQVRDFLIHWDTLKNKNIGRSLNYDIGTTESFHRFLREHDDLAQLLLKYHDTYDIETMKHYYDTADEEDLKALIIDDINEAVTKVRSNRDYVSNAEMRTYLKYHGMEDFVYRMKLQSPEAFKRHEDIINRIKEIGVENILNSSISLDFILHNGADDVVSIIEEFGIENIDEFNKSSNGSLTNDNCRVLHEIYSNYFQNGHFFGEEGNRKYTKEDFNEVIRRMIIQSPRSYVHNDNQGQFRNYRIGEPLNYSAISGDFRTTNADLYLDDENVPDSFRNAFYTKKLTPQLIHDHRGIISSLKGKDLTDRIEQVYVGFYDGSRNWHTKSIIPFLLEEYGFDKAMELIADYTPLRDIFTGQFHYSGDPDKPIADIVYEVAYEAIITGHSYGWIANMFQYSETMSESFKKRFPGLFLDGIALPDQVRQDFYSGKLKSIDYLTYWDIFKNRDIGRTLERGTTIEIEENSEIQENVNRFISEYGELARVLFKTHSYSLANGFYSAADDKTRWEGISNAIKKQTYDLYRHNGQKYVPNEDFQIYLKCQTINQFFEESVLGRVGKDYYRSLEEIQEVAAVVKHYGIDNILVSSVPIDLILTNKSVMSFVREFGIDNIDAFNNASGGFLSENDCELLQQYANYFKWIQESATGQGIFITDNGASTQKQYTKKAFFDVVRDLAVNGGLKYQDIQGEFRTLYPELFISEDAPPELVEAFYNRNVDDYLLSNNPEYVQFLRGTDLNLLRSYYQSELTKIQNAFGRETGWDIFLAHYDSRDDLRVIASIIDSKYNDRMTMEEKLAMISDEAIKDETEYYRVFAQGDYYNGEYTQLREEHPELFLPANVPEDIREILEKRLYNRNLSGDFLAEHPEYLQYLKGVNVEVIFDPIMVDVRNLHRYSTNNEKQNLIGYFKKLLGNEATLYLMVDYYRYFYRDRGSAEFDISMSGEEAVAQLKKTIYTGIKKNRNKYDDRMPQQFKEEHPELFLPENMPDDIKEGLSQKFYSRNLTAEDLTNNPEYIEYLKGIDIELTLSPLSVSVSIDDSSREREDVNLIEYFKRVFGNDAALDVLGSYGKYIYDIHYNHRHDANAAQFAKLMVTYARAIDRGPGMLVGSADNVPPEIMQEFIEFGKKMGAEEVLRHMKNLVYTGIKDMRIPFDDSLPEQFKAEHPELFLPENMPDDIRKNLGEYFYNRGITAEYLAEHPEYIEYLGGIDIEVLFPPMQITVVAGSQEKSWNESANLMEYFKRILGNETALSVMFSYGKYLERIYKKSSYNGPIEKKFTTSMNPEDVISELKKVIYSGIIDSRIIYDKQMPRQFQEEFPELFLPENVPGDIEKKFYDRKLTLEDFQTHPDILAHFRGIDLACYIEEQFSWLIGLFSDHQNPNAVRLKTAEEYTKVKVDTLQERFRNHVIKNKDVITEENIVQVAELLYRLSYSNSSEMLAFGKELADQLLLEQEPMRILDEIEGVFLRNNLPTVGKVYSVFQLRYPDFRGFYFESEKMSPALRNNATRKRDGIRVLDLIIFSDLIKASFGSNNRSIRDYLESIEKGTELISQITSRQIQSSQLDEESSKFLKTFVAHLNTLHNNTVIGKGNPRFLSNNIDGDIHELLSFFTADGTPLPDRLIRMFCGPAGFRSFEQAKQYMKTRVESADLKNRETAESGITLEAGDFIKGIGDITYLRNILQNGSVAREFLGASSGSDYTPLDTDISIILNATGNIYNTIAGTVSESYGPIYFVLKNDGRFTITRRSSSEKNQEITERIDLKKLEAFYTGVIGSGEHYGIRTGFASSEVDYIVTKNEDARIGLEIAKNGFYIPVVDKNGNLIFSPEDYDSLRAKMSGLSYYGTGDYIFAENLSTPEIEEIASSLKGSKREIEGIRKKILETLKTPFALSGLRIKSQIDGDLTERHVEVIDTGSTGRGTCMAMDIDFDFAIRLDRKIKDGNPKQLEQLERSLLEALGKTGAYKTNGRYILEDVRIEGIDQPLKIDLSFYDRTDVVSYSTDMALEDRLRSISEQSLEKYPLVLANIILAKNILKKANVYKARQENGLGGVGVENWILQHGGSLEAAAKSFLEASENRSFEEFRRVYCVWDFGENHESEKKGIYPHDNFVWNNMNEVSYDKMKRVLTEYLKNLYSDELEVDLEEQIKIENIERVDFGSGEMYQCVAADGKTYLFKPALKKNSDRSQSFRAYIQEAAYELQRRIDPASAIFCKATIVNDMFGAIQEKIEVNDTPYVLEDKSISSQLMREFVIDYLLCNHDGYRRNFILGTDGIFRGIDKEQSFRFISNEPEEISMNYNPNGGETAYNEIFRKYAEGQIDLDFDNITSYLDIVDQMDDDEYMQIFQKYISSYARDTIEKKKLMEQIMDRKTHLRERMTKFISTLQNSRAQLSVELTDKEKKV